MKVFSKINFCFPHFEWNLIQFEIEFALACYPIEYSFQSVFD